MDYLDIENILDSSLDGIHITDSNGVTLFFNKTCEDIENIKKEDIIGKNMIDLVKDGVYSNSVALEVIKHKKPIKLLQNVNDKQILAHGSPIFKNNVLDKVVITARDITYVRNLEKEFNILKDTNNVMTKELSNLKNTPINNSLIFSSDKMDKIVSLSKKIALVNSTILITGESGVGKGVLSKFIHENSLRCDKAFIKIDCNAIPESLIESELFGYEKGAFTGANNSGKVGLVELAHNGTLFLDEIGEISLSLQVKLLNLIQDKEFFRVGSKNKTKVDVRIITATNKDLAKLVKEGKFREDLYYRLNVIPISIPSLRNRPEDILPLINLFLDKFNKKYNMNKSISKRCLNALLEYSWPGNIRELENIIERILVVSDDDIVNVDDLPSEILVNSFDKSNRFVGDDSSLDSILGNYEKKILMDIKKSSVSADDMAKKLRVNVTTIRRKLHKYNIDIKF